MSAPGAGAQLPDVLEIGRLGEDGITCAGPSLASKLGSCVAGGFDVDADGYDDVLLGANRANPPGRPFAGCAFLLRGSPEPPAFLDLGGRPAGVTEIWGAQADDGLGTASRGGFDFNGDGFDDLVVTAYKADPLGRTDAGVAAVLLGGAPLPAVIDLASPPPSVLLIAGPEPGHGLGVEAKPAGDVDGDGHDDILLGAPFADPLGRIDAGVGWLVRGGASSPAILDLADPGARATAFLGEITGGRFAESAAGDMQRGGLPVVAFGAPNVGPGAAGRVYVVALPTPLPETIDLATPGAASVTYLAAAGDQCGASLGNAGDRNGDGSEDLLIASLRASAGGLNGRGRVDVVDVEGAPEVVDLCTATPLLRVLGAANSAQLGYSVADAFDADGDGEADLLMGMRGFDLPGADNAGAAVLVTGIAELGPLIDLSVAPAGVHVITGDATSATLGYDVDRAGDLDRSGFPDLLIGAINAQPSGGTTTGAAYAVHDRVTSVALDASVSGSAQAGGSIELALRAEAGDQIILIAGGTPVEDLIELPPHQYGLWIDPAQMILGPTLVLPASGELALSFPYAPVPVLQGVGFALQAFAKRSPAGAFSNLRELTLP
ncbi:MAG: hypothetical protein ACYTG2_10160 [Planctomycetota bacterium]